MLRPDLDDLFSLFSVPLAVVAKRHQIPAGEAEDDAIACVVSSRFTST